MVKSLFSKIGARVFIKALGFQLCFLLGLLTLGSSWFSVPEIFVGSLLLAAAAGIASTPVVSEVETKAPDNAWRFLYLLVTERRAMLIIFCSLLALSALASWEMYGSRVAVEYSESTGFAIRLASQTIYYEPVSPYGWQDTRIKFEKGDRFAVPVTGRMSPAFLRGHKELQENLVAMRSGSAPMADPSQFQWPFVGPEGYSRSWYESNPPALAAGYSNDHDFRLTVKGLPHARLVGVILESGQMPRVAPKNPTEEGYSLRNIAGQAEPRLFDLSAKRDDYPKEFVASSSGYLWVTINDADEYRWDNAGMFFLQVVK